MAYSWLAGLIALKDMSKRLGEDHAKAQVIAQALAKSRHVSIDPALVRARDSCSRPPS